MFKQITIIAKKKLINIMCVRVCAHTHEREREKVQGMPAYMHTHTHTQL